MSTIIRTLPLTRSSVPSLVLQQGLRTLTQQSQRAVQYLYRNSCYIHHRNCSGISGSQNPWIKSSKNEKDSLEDPVEFSQQRTESHALYSNQNQRNHVSESSYTGDYFPDDGRQTSAVSDFTSYDKHQWPSYIQKPSASDHPPVIDGEASVLDRVSSNDKLPSTSGHFSSFDNQLNDVYSTDRGSDDSSPAPLMNREVDDSNLVSGRQSNLLPSQRKRQHSDLLLVKIRQCQNSEDVYNICDSHKEVMGIHHIIASLDKLAAFVSDSSEEATEIRKSSVFHELGHSLFVKSRQLDVDQTVEILKLLCRLNVPADSKLMQTILQILRHNINDLELNQITFLDFILRKMWPKTYLATALITAIPILAEARLDRRQFAELSPVQLSRLLRISYRCKRETQEIVTEELWQRCSEIQDASLALSLAWSLVTPPAKIYKADRQSKNRTVKEKLLSRCLYVIANNIQSLPPMQVITFFHRLSRVYVHEFGQNSDHEMFLQAFIHCCLAHKPQFRPTAAILKQLFKMNYQYDKLVEHLTETVVHEADDILTEKFGVLSLLECLALCTQHLPHLSQALHILLSSKAYLLTEDNYHRAPLLNMALSLLSLDYHYPELMNILTNRDTLDKYMSHYPANHFNHIKLVEIDQALRLSPCQSKGIPESFLDLGKRLIANKAPSRSSLTSMLHQVLGDGYIVSGVITEEHAYIDHLLLLDGEGQPIPVSSPVDSQGNVRIDVLDIPAGCIRLAIMDVGSSFTFRPGYQIRGQMKLRQRVLEAAGFQVMLILQMALFDKPQDEKLLYIIQELKMAGVTLNDTLQMVTLGSLPQKPVLKE